MSPHALLHLADVEVDLVQSLARELDLAYQLALDLVRVALVGCVSEEELGGGLEHRGAGLLGFVVLVVLLEKHLVCRSVDSFCL